LIVFAFLPFQSLLNDIFAGSISIVAVCKDVLMVVVCLSTLLYYLAPHRRWYLDTITYCLLIFAAVSTMYVAFSPHFMRAVLQLRFLSLYPFIALIVANALETRADLYKVLRVVAVIGLITVIYGIFQYLFQFDVSYRTSTGSVRLRMWRFGEELGMVSTFASRPSFGGYLVPLFLLFLRVKLWQSRKSAWVLRMIALVSIGACIVLTYSRSSWLSLVVGLFVVFYFHDRFKAFLMALVLIVTLTAFYSVKSIYLSRELAEAATSGESFEIRLHYWPMVASHLADSPFGIGLGMVGGPHLFELGANADSYGNLQYDPQSAFDLEGKPGPDNVLSVTDNSFLKLFVQGGFLLLFVFLCLVGIVLHSAFSILRIVREQWLRDAAVWAIASFASLLTIFMFVDFIESAPAISIYWLGVGVLCFTRKYSMGRQPLGSGSQSLRH